MPEPHCEPIEQAIHMLTHQIRDIDDRIAAQETEALNAPHPLLYFALQRKVDPLIKEERALQEEWNDAMTELALCRSNPFTR